MAGIRRSPRGVAWRRLLLLVVVSALCLLLAELALRVLGYTPFSPRALDIRVEPGGRYFRRHPTLGYSHLPGRFRIELPSQKPGASPDDVLVFLTTHREDTLRITEPEPTVADRPAIWIFGGSYTHGWSLDDDETYPWLLQQRFPAFDVENFGVSGYGTLQSLIQLEERLEVSTPAVVVATWAWFHDRRNTYLRQRQKEVVPWNRLGELEQPFARLSGDGELVVHSEPVRYRELPGMRVSALAHALEDAYDRLEASQARSHEVTRALLARMEALCADRGVDFVVAVLTRDAQSAALVRYLRDRGVHAVDLSVERGPGMTNLPYDIHPSARANREFARKLGDDLAAHVLAANGLEPE